MHFSADITLGQIVVFITLLGAIWKANRVLTIFSIEHEILITDWCKRQTPPLEVMNLPTRKRVKWPI